MIDTLLKIIGVIFMLVILTSVPIVFATILNVGVNWMFMDTCMELLSYG